MFKGKQETDEQPTARSIGEQLSKQGSREARTVPLGRLLIERNLLSEDQLAVGLAEQVRSGKPLGQVLVELGFVPEATVAQALATQHGGVIKTEYGFATGFSGDAPRRTVLEEPLISPDDPYELPPSEAPPQLAPVDPVEPPSSGAPEEPAPADPVAPSPSAVSEELVLDDPVELPSSDATQEAVPENGADSVEAQPAVVAEPNPTPEASVPPPDEVLPVDVVSELGARIEQLERDRDAVRDTQEELRAEIERLRAEEGPDRDLQDRLFRSRLVELEERIDAALGQLEDGTQASVVR